MTSPGDPQLPAWANRPATPDGLTDAQLATFIGPRWEPTYRKKLAGFREDPSFVPTWNWPAAVFVPLWFLYRKLYLAFAVFFIVPNLIFPWLTGSEAPLTMESMQDPENRFLVSMRLAVTASTMLAAGGSANWLLFRRARAATRLVALQSLPAEESEALLRRIGGVNRGATAFMLVMVLMGLFVASRA